MTFRAIAMVWMAFLAGIAPVAFSDDTVVLKEPGAIFHVPEKTGWTVENQTSIKITSHVIRDGESRDLDGSSWSVLIMRSGAAEYSAGGTTVSLSERDCLLTPASKPHRITAKGKAAEMLEIRFTRASGSATPSLSPETPVPLDGLQFFKPAENIDARMVTTPSGQCVFVRMDRDAVTRREKIQNETYYLITRGTATATVDGGQIPLMPGDILHLANGNNVSFTTGERGTDAIAVFDKGRIEYANAYEERMAVYHTLIAPDTKPHFIIDGENSTPGLTFTEGPSWMNGRFYFSNYYKFWKPWGSSDEGGVWVVEEDGSYRVLNKNVQTCGTTPLPNGKLAVCDLFGRSVVEMDPETGEMGETIVGSYDGVPFAVANDVMTDRKGGLYVTDSAVAKEGPKQPGTALYYHNAAGETFRVTEPNEVDYINGVIVTPDDKTLYLNGSGELYVWAFDVKPDGLLENKRPFAKLYVTDEELDKETPRSVADGMTIDSDGNIYVATPLGLQVFDSRGRFLGIINVPKGPSHCTFGGSDLKTLYITARTHIYSIRLLRTGLQFPLR